MARRHPGESQHDDLPKAKLSLDNLKKARYIFSYTGKEQWKFWLGMLFLLGTGATAVIFPKVMGMLVDSGEISIEKINEIGLWLMLLFVVQSVFSYFRVYLFVDVTQGLLASLRKATYQSLITKPMSYLNERRVGELNSRISADVSQIQDTFTTSIAEFLRQLIIIAGGSVMLFMTSWKLALIMLGILPVMAALAVVFGRFIRKMSRQVQDLVADSNTIVEETLQGIANVKAFTNEWFEAMRYGKSVNEIRDTGIKLGRYRAAFVSFIVLCLFGSIILLLWIAVRMKASGELSSGDLFTFMFYLVFIGGSIGGIPEQYAQIQRGVGATDRVLEIIHEPSEPIALEERKISTESRLSGHIQFQNVGFAYPSRPDLPVLMDISLEIEPGQRVALIGQSGAGKSTLSSLLLRFYDKISGEIAVDGKPIETYELSDLRSQMAIVPQEVLLFGGSIHENIGYGKPGASYEEIVEAAKKANAHEFIMQFPEGYDTVVGERGLKLSGGQRQRVAIARALLKNPSILILDEATSSLDSESEALVQEALNTLMQGRTSLVIAHRLSTIRNADKIFVLQQGAIIESGNHQQLMQRQSGVYKKYVEMQMEPELA